MNKSQIKQKKQWTDEERNQLAAQLDAEFDQFIADLVQKNKDKEKHEVNIEEVIAQDQRCSNFIVELCIMGFKKSLYDSNQAVVYSKKVVSLASEKIAFQDLEGHPAFLRSEEDIDYSKPLHPALEGLMAIKYEDENPTARANSYREDGNITFKKKQYRIAIENYTEAIISKSPDRKLNAVCYTNRAAAQYHLGNYGSAYRDCIFARKFQPDHWKAIIRGADCCMRLSKYTEAIKWIDAALLLEPGEEELLEMRAKAVKSQKEKERDERKQAAKERKEEEEDRKLLALIEKRGIQVGGLKKTAETAKLNPLLFTSLESHNPSGAKVHVDETGTMFWPVLFFYPEHGQTDFIEAFNENDVFSDHLLHMFGPEVPFPDWDEDHKYKPEDLEIYFEDRDKEELHQIDQSSTLLKALKHKKYKVNAGTPCFIILVSGSKCRTDYLKRYNYKT